MKNQKKNRSSNFSDNVSIDNFHLMDNFVENIYMFGQSFLRPFDGKCCSATALLAQLLLQKWSFSFLN